MSNQVPPRSTGHQGPRLSASPQILGVPLRACEAQGPAGAHWQHVKGPRKPGCPAAPAGSVTPCSHRGQSQIPVTQLPQQCRCTGTFSPWRGLGPDTPEGLAPEGRRPVGAGAVSCVCTGSRLLACQHSPLISVIQLHTAAKIAVGKRAGSGPLPSLIPTVHHVAPKQACSPPTAGSTEAVQVVRTGPREKG